MWDEARAREQRNKSTKDRAEPYLYSDIAVTRERLNTFCEAPVDDQLATLAVLRERIAQNGSVELAVVGIAVAVVVATIVPTFGTPALSPIHSVWQYVGRVLATMILGFVIGVLAAFAARGLFRRDRHREVAEVWLAAYEAALSESAARQGGRSVARSRSIGRFLSPRSDRPVDW